MQTLFLPDLWVMMSLREEGHEVAEGVCFKEELGEHEMRREDKK